MTDRIFVKNLNGTDLKDYEKREIIIEKTQKQFLKIDKTTKEVEICTQIRDHF